MPPKKFAIGGEPDFHNIKDLHLMGYLDLVQTLIFAYRAHDKEIEKVLTKVHHDLSCEQTDRVSKGKMSYGERLDFGFEYNYKMPWDEGYSVPVSTPKEVKSKTKKTETVKEVSVFVPKKVFKPKR